jgi:hypothetical protein
MHRRLQTNDAFAKILWSNHFLPSGWMHQRVNYGQKIIKDGTK